MLKKATFFTDDGLNNFFRLNNSTTTDESTIYLVKFIVFTNPLTRQQEYHVIYSEKSMMKSGQHMRVGVAQNGKV